jgi:hypothetical protein
MPDDEVEVEVVEEAPADGDGATPAGDASATPPPGRPPAGDGAKPAVLSLPPGAAALLGNPAAAAAAAAGSPAADEAAKKAAAAKADKDMCESFRSTFERNQAKYSEAVFESLARYFETPDTMEKLSIILEKYLGMYIRSPKFGDHTEKVINEAFGDVIKRALRKNLKKGANLEGLYRELDKHMQRHTRVNCASTRGGSRKKQKRKTVKRRK